MRETVDVGFTVIVPSVEEFVEQTAAPVVDIV